MGLGGRLGRRAGMILEVTGTNRANRGAELMLIAIREHFRARSAIRLAVDESFGPYEDRAHYGLLQKVRPRTFRRTTLAISLMRPGARRSYGLVTDRDVDGVLDASGFAFGDQHPVRRTEAFARDVERWKKRGIPVILLPQALGPFRRPEIRDAFLRVLSRADLIYARDPASFAHLRELGADATLRLAPDFTNLVDGAPAETHRRVCIVPNARMIQEAPDDAAAKAYLPWLSDCARFVREAGREPVLVVHDDADRAIVGQLQGSVGPIEVQDLRDPSDIKGFLAASALVIGSRFHALVSALSSAVPCIATSWSHKYEALFADYGCEDMVVGVDAPRDELRGRIEALLTGETRESVVSRLQTAGRGLRAQVTSMWAEVDSVLGVESA